METVTEKMQNDVLVIELHGRVDSANAEAVETAINAARQGKTYSAIEIDASDLDYVSSAGLRVVLRLRKAEPTLKITNVSPDVYDIFEMTGFTEMITVEKAFRQMSVEGCDVIGKGAKGTVYRYNADTIVKVYNSNDCLAEINNERELARKAFVLGIPTAISFDVVKVGDKYGSVFELLDAKSFSQLIAENPADLEKYVNLFADMLLTIHGTKVSQNDMPNAKRTTYRWLETVQQNISAEDFAKLKGMVDAVPDRLTMLHCDYHTNNIMMQNGEVLMIDMDTLSYGNPVFDLVNVYFTFEGIAEVDKTNAEQFLGIPYAVYSKVWDIFIRRYLGTDDPAVIKAAENKIKLLSYTRMIRHTVRRGGDDAVVKLAAAAIHGLLAEVDDLAL